MFLTAALAASLLAASAYLIHFRLQPPSMLRIWVKAAAAGALALAAIIVGAPLTLVFFFAMAAIGDSFLAREDEDGLYIAMAVAMLSQVFLCLTLYAAWTGMHAPVVAALGLAGIWIGFFMLIWSNLGQRRMTVFAYSLGVAVALYLSFGTTTYGQFAVIGMLLYVLAQILMSLEYFVLSGKAVEAIVAGHIIWTSYYISLLLFFVAFAVGFN